VQRLALAVGEGRRVTEISLWVILVQPNRVFVVMGRKFTVTGKVK